MSILVHVALLSSLRVVRQSRGFPRGNYWLLCIHYRLSLKVRVIKPIGFVH